MLRIDIEDDEIDFDYNFCEHRGEPFTGELAEYGPDGELLELTTYVDGLTDGPNVSWYPDGTIKHESQSRRGFVVGPARPALRGAGVVYRRALPLATRQLSITHSVLGRDASVVGAMVLGIEHLLSPSGIGRFLSAAPANDKSLQEVK